MYLQLAVLAIFVAVGVKTCNGWKKDAQTQAVAQIEKQYTESADELNKDAERETKRLLALRPARQAVIVKTQAARKAKDAAQSKVDPVYRVWADRPVPDYVVDRLRASAAASGGLYLDASDRKSWLALQPDDPAPAEKDAGSRFGRARLGPARTD